MSPLEMSDEVVTWLPAPGVYVESYASANHAGLSRGESPGTLPCHHLSDPRAIGRAATTWRQVRYSAQHQAFFDTIRTSFSVTASSGTPSPALGSERPACNTWTFP